MKTLRSIAFSLILIFSVACVKDDPTSDIPNQYENVVIFWSDAYNNLNSSIRSNAKTICENALPMTIDRSALVWVSHNSVTDSDYSTATRPVIIRVSSDWSGRAVLDTVKQYELTDRLTDKDIMTDAFTFIRDNYKSSHYGVVFSSHGTGWLPEDYYRKPTQSKVGDVLLKTFGQSYEGVYPTSFKSHELCIPDIADAIPMHLDYMIFDACLMGCVEVAYELRNVTDIIGASQTEVVSSGFDYSVFSDRLLKKRDPLGFCQDYFEYYNSGKGSGSKSATISVVDCSGMEGLAALCSKLFERYRSHIDNLNPDNVQRFFSGEKHWFYDLEDIFVNAGISAEDKEDLDEALSKCIIYEAHTDDFLKRFDIRTSCGFSSFLPCDGSPKLRNYYKTLSWNKATSLVE